MPLAATWMDLEIIILSQTENDKYHDTAYMWNLNKRCKRTYLQNRNRLTDIEDKCGYQRGKVREGDKLGIWH